MGADVLVRVGARRAVLDGEGAAALAWLDESGVGERFRPLREAVASVVHGSDHLLTLAPEVREPAETIAAWIMFRGDAESLADAAPHDSPRPAARRARTKKKAPKRARRRRSLG